jgi:phosphate/phosphite/phosphonate ABC transporter binding protein
MTGIRTAAVLAILLATIPVAHGQTVPPPATEPELVFGMTPVLGVETTQRQFTPLTKYMSALLGVSVKLLVADSYGDLIDRMEAGEVDLVKFSPLAYVRARRRIPMMTLIASHVANGSVTYSSYLVAMQDSPFGSLQDVKGTRICFVDPDSTSGYLYPYAHLLDQGILPEEDFRSVAFGGNHRACLEGLISGRYDLAATFSGALKNAREAGLHVGELVILAKTGRIPYDAYCVRPGMDPALVTRIQKVLLGINTLSRTGRNVLTNTMGINGWVVSDDQRYDDIRKVETRVRKSVQERSP